MFMDESLDVVGLQTSWKKTHPQAHDSKICQTNQVHTAEVETQAKFFSENGTQTDPHECLADPFLLDRDLSSDLPGLKDFLCRVEDMVIEELVKNAKSHAFDGFEVNWADQNQTVLCLYCLGYPDARKKGLQVTSVSWNCTGSVIACAFGRVDDGDWSTESSCVCTWNLDRRNLNPNQPDMVMDVATPVMCVSFHPKRPSLIAGGLYNGDLIIWDTSRTQDPVLAQTGMSPDAHREPVYEVKWVPVAHRGHLIVLSACSGGRVLLWSLDGVEGKLTLNSAYALVSQQLPQTTAFSKLQTKGGINIGVTSLTLSPWDPDTFLVGSEGGLVLKCTFSSQTVAAVPSDGESVTLHAPAQFSFSPRGGPIHSLHFSPFHRNLFVSVGTDGLAHIHSILQPRPLLALRVSDSYVFGVRWSPVRPLVFAAVTGQGLVQVFDLGHKSLRPVATIDQKTGGQPAYCLEFSPQQLLAVGSADGTVNIWQLSAELTEQGPRETAILEQLANEVAE
ncbi:WD repeat-containing protein 34 [Electrophorus electricus]|uniref:WD repeat domain 34 n=1 Tax=Electrophorus electricus TaxID=8005 RepID=A0A4W4H751_ELEEL|nr:WD repeat-containing protein 34 [Electrophorus electricus]